MFSHICNLKYSTNNLNYFVGMGRLAATSVKNGEINITAFEKQCNRNSLVRPVVCNIPSTMILHQRRELDLTFVYYDDKWLNSYAISYTIAAIKINMAWNILRILGRFRKSIIWFQNDL